MKTIQMPSFPPKSNPFRHDAFHMGTTLGSNCYVMFANHDDKPCDYLIICNTETGERTKIYLNNPKIDSENLDELNGSNMVHSQMEVM